MPKFFNTKVGALPLSIVMFTLLMFQGSAVAQPEGGHSLTVLKNMQTDAAQANKLCVPMVIMVSQFSCVYCEKLREQVLLPLLKSGAFDDKALIRELLIDPDEFVTELNGNTSTGRQVATQYIDNIVTPTILIIDSSGNEVVERIVGISNIDFYSAYLEKQINAAYQKSSPGCSQDQEEK